MRSQINQALHALDFILCLSNISHIMNKTPDKAPDKALIRDSITTHLETLKSFGVDQFERTAPALSAVEGYDVQRTTNEKQSTKHEEPSIEDPEQSRRTNPIDAEELTSCHSLEDLQNLMGNCGRCPLHKGRKNIVFGVGNPNADLMFVGEGPGADEDEQGIPFVGKAGRLLTRMIEAMGYKRDDVYIANVVKCRPPGNRNPEPNEIEACMPFLKTQIKTINPKAIVCLGKFAAQTLLETQTAISRIRGTFQDVDNYAVMPTFHPAYLLRNAGMKKLVWEDLKKVMAKLKET